MIFTLYVFELDYLQVIATVFPYLENSLDINYEIYCRGSYLIQCFRERQRIANINENDSKMEMPAVPIANPQAGLTTFSEVAPEIVQSEPSDEMMVERFAGPYPSPELQKQIEKMYPIFDGAWKFSQVEHENVCTLYLPELLLDKPFIEANLEGYMWHRSDIEYEVKISATKFHVGKLNVSHSERANEQFTAFNDPRKRLDHESSKPLYASSVNSIKDVIKRHAPTAWDRIRGDGFIPHAIGTIYVDVQNPLASLQTGEPTDVRVSVYARFINSDVKGFGPQASSSLLGKVKKFKKALGESATKKSKFTKKKDPVAKEAEVKSSKGVISGVLEAAGTLAPLLLMTPFPELAPVAAAAASAAPFVRSLGLSKPDNVSSVEPTIIAPYRDLVPTHGLSQAVKLACHPEASLAHVALNSFKQHMVADIIRKPGFLGSITINSLTAMKQFLFRFPSCPTLANMWDGNVAGDRIFYPTWAAYVSQFFSTYKGGMKYIFEFVSNDFVSTRARFWHLPCDHATTSPDDFAGSAVTIIEDIRGNTIVEFTVPKDDRDVAEVIGGWVHIAADDSDMALAIPSLERHPFVAMDLVAPVTVSDPGSISTMYINVYAAAAEDMEFMNYQGFNLRRPSVPLEEVSKVRSSFKQSEPATKKSLFRRFEKSFRPIGESKGLIENGLVSNERVGTIENLCKRYEEYQTNSNLVVPAASAILMRNDKNRTLKSWARMFMWWRGSLRYKITDTAIPTKQVKQYPFYPTGDDGLAEQDGYIFPGYLVETTLAGTGSTHQTADVEILWDSTQYAAYCDPVSQNINDDSPSRYSQTAFPNSATGPNFVEGYWSVGEDFMFGQLLTPPIWVWEAVPPGAKTRSSKLAESSDNKGKNKA